MMCLDLDDKIIERAKINRMTKNTRIITNAVLWTGFGCLVISGTIGLKFLGNLLVLGITNKGTRWIIKNRKNILKKQVI